MNRPAEPWKAKGRQAAVHAPPQPSFSPSSVARQLPFGSRS